MSRKTRNHKSSHRSIPVSTPAARDPGAAAGQLASMKTQAQDGYSNAAAFLGQDSPLISAGTFLRSGITSNPQMLTTAYREFWIAMRIIDTPAEDMTRAWYTLTGDVDPEDMEELKRLEAKHSVKQELTNALRFARLYGGSLALMVIRGEEDRLDQPLDLDLIPPESFQGLMVLDRTEVSPSLELETDLDDPDYGLPMYYDVDVVADEYSTVRIHHSRVLRFVGRELPKTETVAENYWGASELEHLWDELQKRSATSANIAQLVFQANITTLKMSNFGESVGMGTEKGRQGIRSLIEEENRFRTSYGLQLLSKDDQMENHPYSFTGLSDVYEAFMMDIAGAAEIPATKLFGRSPQGFQSTGESDLRNYYEMISGLQERHLRPALERLLPVMAISCFGYLPDNLDFLFNPLATMTAEQMEDLAGKLSTRVRELYEAGIITLAEARDELRATGEKYAVYGKLSDDLPASPPDADTGHFISAQGWNDNPAQKVGGSQA